MYERDVPGIIFRNPMNLMDPKAANDSYVTMMVRADSQEDIVKTILHNVNQLNQEELTPQKIDMVPRGQHRLVVKFNNTDTLSIYIFRVQPSAFFIFITISNWDVWESSISSELLSAIVMWLLSATKVTDSKNQWSIVGDIVAHVDQAAIQDEVKENE